MGSWYGVGDYFCFGRFFFFYFFYFFGNYSARLAFHFFIIMILPDCYANEKYGKNEKEYKPSDFGNDVSGTIDAKNFFKLRKSFATKILIDFFELDDWFGIICRIHRRSPLMRANRENGGFLGRL